MNVQNNFPHPFNKFLWRLTLARVALMFYFSSQAIAPNSSRGLLSRMLNILHVRVSPGTFGCFHSLLRKLTHLTEWSMFALPFVGGPGERRQLVWRLRIP